MFMESSFSVAGRFTEDGRAFAASLPCAGITQIRFDGCDLSRPLKGSTPWLTSPLALRADLGKPLWSSALIAQPTIGAPKKHGRISPKPGFLTHCFSVNYSTTGFADAQADAQARWAGF